MLAAVIALSVLVGMGYQKYREAIEEVPLQQKVEEIRLVDRAKCALIQYLNMTEAQAHRHIEKQAMDLRVSRAKIAQSILNTYES